MIMGILGIVKLSKISIDVFTPEYGLKTPEGNEITPSNFILSVLFSEEDEEFNKTESPSPSLEEFSIDEALGFQILENHLEGGAIGIKLETDFGNDFRYKRKWYTHDVGISGGYRSYRVKRTAWFEGQIHVTERVRRTNNTTGATYGNNKILLASSKESSSCLRAAPSCS